MGLMQLPHYRFVNIVYVNKVKNVMPRDCFKQLLQMWHFNNNEDTSFSSFIFQKRTPLINKVKERFQKGLTSGSFLWPTEIPLVYQKQKAQIWNNSIKIMLHRDTYDFWVYC